MRKRIDLTENINDLIPRKIKYVLVALIIFMVISLTVFIVSYFYSGYSIFNGKIDFDIISAIGSFMSGLLGPILSIISSLLFYYSLKTQYYAYKQQLIENKESVRQFTISAKSLDEQKVLMFLQNWEQVFFKLLEEYDKFVNSLSYCIQFFYDADRQRCTVKDERIIDEIFINKTNNGSALMYCYNKPLRIMSRENPERIYLEKNEKLHNNIMSAIINHIKKCPI